MTSTGLPVQRIVSADNLTIKILKDHGMDIGMQSGFADTPMQDSQMMLRLALEASQAGCWAVDLSTGKIFWSEEYFRLLGLDPQTFTPTYESWLAIIHADDRERVDQDFQAAVTQQREINIEFRIIRPDGTVRWILRRARVYTDEAGKPRKVIGMGADVTERWRIEQALREREQFNLSVVESSRDCIKVLDLAGRLLSMNKHGQESLGITDFQPYLNQSWVEFWDVKDRAAARAALEAAVAGGIGNFVGDCAGADGTRQWWDVALTPIPGADGKPERLLAVSRNITAGKLAEAALRESEERFAKAFQASPISLTITSLKTGRLVEVNETFVQVTGIARAEAVGRTTRELGLWANADDREAELAMIAAQGHLRNLEYRFRTKNGSEIIGLLSAERLEIGGEPCALTVIEDITERKRAEQALRESEGRFRGLMEQAPFSIQVFAPDGRTRRVNKAWEQLWGVSLEQVAEYNILHDPQLEAKGIAPYIRRAFAGEAVEIPAIQYDPNETIPDRTRHQDPKRWVAAVAYPLQDHAGQIREVVLIHQDITEHRRAEEALREGHALLRTAMDAGRLGAWDWDIQHNKVTWTERIYEFHGLEPGTFGGTVEDFASLVHPEDLPAVQSALAQTLDKQLPYELEFRIIQPSGAHRWLFTRAEVFTDQSGTPLRLIGTVQDITTRKQAEEQLRESEGQLQLLADSMPQVVWMADAQGVVHYYNQRAAEFSGTLRDPKGAWDWQPVLHPDDVQPTLDTWQRAVREKSPYAQEHRILMADGTYRWHLSRGIPVLDAVGQLQRWYGTATDIHDLKEADAERERLLRQEKRARASAEAANRAKDEFLAVVSHELRNPLNSMLGYVRLVRTNPHDATTVERHCEIIERNALIQKQLIEDLLDTARIISGKLQLEVALTDLRLVLEEAVAVVRPAAEAKQIDLIAQLGDQPQEVSGDAARLQQVVWNLLQNAIKFTPEGGRVELRLERGDGHVRIIVSDTGQGIEPEFLPAVFDRFSQRDMSRTRRHGGLGLGLALVKQLVELHGGTIAAASAGLGLGATFTVTLPLRVPQSSAYQPRPIAEVRTDSDTIPLEALPRLDGVRVLLVDDQEEARFLLANTLNSWGAVVTMAASGPEARARLAESSFDVLVCDIAMPGEDGYEVIGQIRRSERQRRVPPAQRLPAIALTAMARAEDRLQALSAGFQMHVAKPIELAELVVVIDSLTRNRQKGAA
jgi:PAS domain S-box-containing protein